MKNGRMTNLKDKKLGVDTSYQILTGVTKLNIIFNNFL